MGQIYLWNKNPFRDFLLRSLIYGVDISDKNAKADINNTFNYILENVLKNEEDAVYLDFSITNKNNHFKLTGKNAISALWFSGILPEDTSEIFKQNIFIFGDRKYTYNKKTKELKYIVIQN